MWSPNSACSSPAACRVRTLSVLTFSDSSMYRSSAACVAEAGSAWRYWMIEVHDARACAREDQWGICWAYLEDDIDEAEGGLVHKAACQWSVPGSERALPNRSDAASIRPITHQLAGTTGTALDLLIVVVPYVGRGLGHECGGGGGEGKGKCRVHGAKVRLPC